MHMGTALGVKTPRELLQEMFAAAIEAAQPAHCLPPHLAAIRVAPGGRLIVIGAGKASAAMARAVEDHWPGELSGGELQRFCIARAIRLETRFLIADEITTMLDAITQARIWHFLIRICRERSIGLLVVSHDPALLGRICDKIVELEGK